MKNKKNVPKIRFKGFTEEWKKQRLGNKDITSSYSGGTPSVGVKEYYYNGSIPFIRSGEINSNNTELFITDNGLDNSSAKMVEVGDILYALYGATSGEVGISKINGAINQAIMAIKPKVGYSTYFIAYWLRKEKNNIIRTYLQGGQGNLSSAIVKELEIGFPEKTGEQQAIGNYFQNIDRLINTSQTKLDKLKNIKKGCLEKMFPRNGSTTSELGFKGFTDEWKEIKVKNLGNVITGSTPSKTEPRFWGGNFIWVTAQDLKNKYINDSILKLTIQGKEKARVIPKNSIIITCIASIGLNGINNVECATNQQINSIVCNDEYYYEYIYYAFEYRANLLRGIAGQTAVPIINKSTFEDFLIISPKSKIEQEKIGNIFKNLDDLIAKTEQQINKLKNIKKACLDKMFVNE